MSRSKSWSLKLTAAAGLAAVAVLGPATPSFAGVSGPSIYVNDQLFRTVGTPTDLSATGAPAQAWDLIYDFGGVQPSVATAAPGDPGYTGGRWMVHAVTFPDGYAAALAGGDLNGDGLLDSAAEVSAAVTAGTAVDHGVVRQFECPVIPLPHG